MGHGQAGGGRQRGRTLARRKPCCHGTPALAGAVEAGAGDGTGTCEASSRVGDSTSTEMLLAARGGALHPTAQQPQEGRQSASAAEAEAAATRRRAAACHAENTKICARSSLGSAGCVQLAAGCACQAGTATQGQGHSNRAGHCATQACPACQAHLTSPSMAGMRKAMVLPVPVLARAITSPPASTCAEGESVVGGWAGERLGEGGQVGGPAVPTAHTSQSLRACMHYRKPGNWLPGMPQGWRREPRRTCMHYRAAGRATRSGVQRLLRRPQRRVCRVLLLAAEALTAGIVASWTWVRLVKPSTSCRARWLAGDSGRLAKVVEVRWAGAPGGSAAAGAATWWAGGAASCWCCCCWWWNDCCCCWSWPGGR